MSRAYMTLLTVSLPAVDGVTEQMRIQQVRIALDTMRPELAKGVKVHGLGKTEFPGEQAARHFEAVLRELVDLNAILRAAGDTAPHKYANRSTVDNAWKKAERALKRYGNDNQPKRK